MLYNVVFVSAIQQYETATCMHTPPSSTSLPPTLPPSHPSRSSGSSSRALWTSWKVSYCCRGKIFLWEGAFFRHLNNYLVCPGLREKFDVTGTYGWVMGTSSDSVNGKLGTWGLLRHVRGLAFREILSCYKWGIPWLYLCLSGVILEKALKTDLASWETGGCRWGFHQPRWDSDHAERKNGIGQAEVSLIEELEESRVLLKRQEPEK